MSSRRNLILVTAGVLIFAASCSGGSEGPSPTAPSSPTVALSPVGSPAPSASPTGSPAAEALAQGDPLAFPQDVAFILETGCWQCDAPTTGFSRVYRDPSGRLKVDTLFTVEDPRLEPRPITTSKGVEQSQPYITGFATAPDAADMILGLCVQESCGSGGLDAWSQNAVTRFLRSTDGGVTWTKMGELQAGAFVLAYAGPGRVLVGTWPVEAGPASFMFYPDLTPVTIPETGAWPVAFIGGDVVWYSSGGRILRSDGSVIADFGEGAAIYWVSEWRSARQGGFIVSWSRDGGGSDQRYYLSYLDPSGTLVKTYQYDRFSIARLDAGEASVLGNADIDQSLLGAPTSSTGLTYLPSLFDLSARTVRPVAELQPLLPRGRNHVIAVQKGPFARVVDTGSCLNIRGEPSAVSPVLTCAADGVLLRDSGETRLWGDTVWLRVATPAGVEGWASTQYLER